MSKPKGDRRERQAEKIYREAGFLTWRPARSRAGKNDIFGLYDMVALGPRGLDLVQIKANGARGIEDFRRNTYPFQTTRGICPVMMVCYDGQGGHDPTPPRWRVVIPSGEESHVDVVDERDDGVPDDGEGVLEWLETPRERASQ